MSTRVNLADADYEPSDEDLDRLAREAFSGVAERHAVAVVAMKARIAELRAASAHKPLPARTPDVA